MTISFSPGRFAPGGDFLGVGTMPHAYRIIGAAGERSSLFSVGRQSLIT